eukprot:919213-Pyramimonas_sp.AAC.1
MWRYPGCADEPPKWSDSIGVPGEALEHGNGSQAQPTGAARVRLVEKQEGSRGRSLGHIGRATPC